MCCFTHSHIDDTSGAVGASVSREEPGIEPLTIWLRDGPSSCWVLVHTAAVSPTGRAAASCWSQFKAWWWRWWRGGECPWKSSDKSRLCCNQPIRFLLKNNGHASSLRSTWVHFLLRRSAKLTAVQVICSCFSSTTWNKPADRNRKWVEKK